MIDLEAELHREQSGGEVAEISGWHDKDRLHALGQLSATMNVVETLRHEAREVDRVGRGEVEVLGEFAIEEGGFHQGLAIVEGAIDFERGDVTAERGELFFLKAGDFTLWVEDHHAGARNVVKRRSNGATGIAGSRDQNSEHACVVAGEPCHEAGHEACAEVLEGEGGAVEKFEDMIAGAEGYDRRVEADCAIDDFAQRVLRHIFAEEGLGDGEADFLKAHRAPARPEIVT